MAIVGGPTSYRKWIPIELAERLHVLQQGTLNVGNTQQNRLNLRTLAIAQANAPSNPAWARWSKGFSNSSSFGSAGPQPIQVLEVYPVLVPGFTKPPNT